MRDVCGIVENIAVQSSEPLEAEHPDGTLDQSVEPNRYRQPHDNGFAPSRIIRWKE